MSPMKDRIHWHEHVRVERHSHSDPWLDLGVYGVQIAIYL